mmetsp:Transcript_41411/g.93384  ORF Transcript_41411/g.93384 Transcript_41411/m.93384 type:complete len:530 (-) Transcript_41411:6-1595(-)
MPRQREPPLRKEETAEEVRRRALFDFDELENLVNSTPGTASVGGADPEQRQAEQADRELEAFLEEQVWVAPALNEEKFYRIKEVPHEVIQKWTKSSYVKYVFKQFIVEDRIGIEDTIRIRDVSSMLEAMGFSLKVFVLKFVPHVDGAKAGDIKKLADEILRRFASQSLVDRNSMKHGDVYRLLEFLGYNRRMFVNKFIDGVWTDAEDQAPVHVPDMVLGQYRIKDAIGSGIKGVCCFMAEHISDRTNKVAIKWPVLDDELSIMTDIHKQLSGDVGVLSRVLDSGISEDGKRYLVTDLLGSTLTKVFERLLDEPVECKWRALCIIGRLMLRRLEAVHSCGYVHCDISPENFLLGPAKLGSSGGGVAPYLIDFGLARKYPDGEPLEGDKGSAEWNSIRSAKGGNRLPQDDLEALGWMLAFGFCGGLPWCEWLLTAYDNNFKLKHVRENVIKRVTKAKIQLLQDGWTGFGDKWKVPDNLDQFVRVCQNEDDITHLLDYGKLAKLLGAREHVSRKESELEDLRQFQEHVAPLL